MKNRLTIISLCICLVFCSFSFAFADGDAVIDSKYMSDYSIETQINSDTFNPGEFTVDLAMNAVGWLGKDGIYDKNTSVTFKTGAAAIKLSEMLPNLTSFVMAEEIAKASITGNTFLCSNLPGGYWNGQKGEWTTIINAPVEKIKAALVEFGKYLTVSDPGMRTSDEEPDLPSFFDNMILIKAGTSIQYGYTVINFKKDCEIDELYDAFAQKQYYYSTFAENIFRIKEATSTEVCGGNAIELNLAKGSYMQFCEKKFLANNDISISIDGVDVVGAEPLSDVSAALGTAKKTGTTYTDVKGRPGNPHKEAYDMHNDIHPEKYYYIHRCDANEVFESGFALVNELLGVLAQKDATILVASNGGEAAGGERQPDSAATVAAEIRINSKDSEPCEHARTVVDGKVNPTAAAEGYSGDIYCADCGTLLEKGKVIDKIAGSIKLNYTSLVLKTGQSTAAETVTFAAGDSIVSVTSSNNNIVKGVKNGTNGVKLTAGKKAGTAKVTVKLSSGLSADITVKVQTAEVACTGLTVTSGTKVTLKKGKAHQIKVTRNPVTCVQKITYKSSNKKVATVTSKGKVKAKKKGTAKIKIKCGKKTKTVKIVVKK